MNAEVRRRLDYQLALEQTQRQLEQDHLVEWLESRVTRDMEDRAVSRGGREGGGEGEGEGKGGEGDGEGRGWGCSSRGQGGPNCSWY